MANEIVRNVFGQLNVDTSALDLTIADTSRNPTAALFICSEPGTLNLLSNDAVMSFGITDFVTSAVVGNSDEDARSTTTNSSSFHADGQVIRMYEAGGTITIRRSATAGSIPGGVRITADQDGFPFYVHVILFFGPEAFCFSRQGQSVSVAHGLSVKPNLGLFLSSEQFNSAGNHSNAIMGMMEDNGTIFQHSMGFRRANGNSTSRIAYNYNQTQAITQIDNNGNPQKAYEMVTNDATNSVFEARIDAVNDPGIIGLLFNFEDVAVSVAAIDSPVSSAVDWTYSGAPSQPQFAFMLAGFVPSIPISGESASASGMSYFAADELGVEFGSGIRTEVITMPVQSQTYANTNLSVFQHDGVLAFRLNNLQFNASGFTVAAADISNVDVTPRFWPAFFISELVVVGAPTLGVTSDTATGETTSIASVSTNKGEGTIYAVVTQSAVTPSHAQIVAGQDENSAAADAIDTITPILGSNGMSFTGLIAATQYYTHFTQEDASLTPAVSPVSADGFITSDVNLPPVVDTPISDQICKIGVAFGPLDVSGNFSDPNADPLTFSQTGLPNGLSIDANGIITGVPTGGFQP